VFLHLIIKITRAYRFPIEAFLAFKFQVSEKSIIFYCESQSESIEAGLRSFNWGWSRGQCSAGRAISLEGRDRENVLFLRFEYKSYKDNINFRSKNPLLSRQGKKEVMNQSLEKGFAAKNGGDGREDPIPNV
jgi:hypothetical protein